MFIRNTVFLALAAFSSSLAQSSHQAARDYIRQHGAEIIGDFADLLSIPNVASDLPNIRRNAEHIRSEFTKRGASMELLELPGIPPVVFGELRAPGATRTLVLYVHYDGQPVDPAQWTNPPFTPVLYSRSLEDGGSRIDWPKAGQEIDSEWRVYARGAGDDKAPIPAILTALDALRAAGIKRTSNLKFFFEGEEEAGSTHLGEYLEKFRDKLDGDIWLFCDGPVHQSRAPQLVFGVRGITGLEITVYGATRNLHSGHYGNWSPNPALRLARLLAGMKDDRGRVLVDRFYDTTEPLTVEERASLKDLPDFDRQLKRELGLHSIEAPGRDYWRSILLPSLNIRGLSSATVGDSARNIVPNQATASLDVRLVKGNDPAHMLDLVEAHIRAQGFRIVRDEPDLETRLAHPLIAKVVRQAGYPAVRTRMDSPAARPIVRAAEKVTGGKILLVPSLGGSLPLYLFDKGLSKPVIIVPIANHDDNQHAPDENLRLANLWYGIELMASIFSVE